jgi:methyltransferase family protein
MLEEIYTKGEFLAKNPTWHVEDSPWKAKQILHMMARNHLAPQTICEVGCGAGEILKQLQERMESTCEFWGYDISPQAIQLCEGRENERLHFKLTDLTKEQDVSFDMILIIDVIEHLEDYYSFLRSIKDKSTYKMIHLPLELTLNMVLSRKLIQSREIHGHLHHFMKDTALQMLRDTNYEIIDYCYTHMSNEMPSNQLSYEIKRQVLKGPRKLLLSIDQDLAVRVLGGSNILMLAK